MFAQQLIEPSATRWTLAQCVLISGYDRAGKSTLSSELSSHFDIPLLELGDYVRGRQASDDTLSQHTSQAYEQMRVVSGSREFTKWILEPQHRQVIISGLRDIQILAALQASYRSTFCIWVESSHASRIQRPRRRSATNISLDADDRIQRGWGIEDVQRSADLVMTNDSSLKSYLAAIGTDAVPAVEEFLNE